MARHPLWTDEYWLLLMQLYLRRPVGLKPLYSKAIVDLSLELHIRPQYLYEQMFRLRQLDTPRIEQLWKKYSRNPKKLSREVSLLRKMNGFGQAEEFYEGVELSESWELDFRPIADGSPLTPMMLIMVLDLYFRLTPSTMVAETPEVAELARMMRIETETVVEVMDVYKFCDPYLNRDDLMITPLLAPCQAVWNRYGNGNPEQLAAVAAQMREYWTSK
ncbi:MAG: hypothetical protein IJV27_01625 [Prevotella sp.]|nr:hypothetical protein [Prevotella sp.]